MTTRMKAERAAGDLLERYGSTDLPVPVDRIATFCGVRVSYQPFDGEDVSGLLYRKPGSDPVIGVNSSNSLVRQRFTIAHELGHLELHKGKELILDRLVRVNFRDSTSSQATDAEEMEANAFAACLLMPKHALQEQMEIYVRRKRVRDEQVVEGLARDFKVSRQAMEFRLINLGLFTPAG